MHFLYIYLLFFSHNNLVGISIRNPLGVVKTCHPMFADRYFQVIPTRVKLGS